MALFEEVDFSDERNPLTAVVLRLFGSKESAQKPEAMAHLEMMWGLNSFPLADFESLSPEDQDTAGELWAARALSASLKRQRERRLRIATEIAVVD